MLAAAIDRALALPSKPAVLRPAAEESPSGLGPFPAMDTDYVYLLMPVRLPG